MILFCRFDIYFELKYRENYPNSELQDLSADYAAELVITDDVLPAEQSRPAAPHGGGGALHNQRPGGVEGGGPGDRETGAVDTVPHKCQICLAILQRIMWGTSKFDVH